MNKKQVLSLLTEAVTTDNWQRRNAIQIELCDAIADTDDDGRSAGIVILISALYVETLRNTPMNLPSLWPVFFMACGDRDSSSILAHLAD